MTGSSLPCRASSVRSRPKLVQGRGLGLAAFGGGAFPALAAAAASIP